MKKILSLILAGLMSLSCAAFVAADDAAAEATADPYQEYAISFLEEYGIYKGGEGLTDADDIQRYQMALFVARIATGWVDDYKWDYNYDWEDNYANNSTFTDLAGTPADKYYGAISYANQMGIIEGYNATQFGPTDGITYRDALTMVVRTLGYTGLAYPWGNIQKAVELGLTEGIDATYTDILSRGEVAVIIYNALFAETKSGETLAKSIFDVDFAWENIVVVSTDEGGFLNAGVRANKGYVGFKILNDDMSLSAKTYYVEAKELGLSGHEEELALGDVYAALFEVEGDLAKIVDADTLAMPSVINNGITDNEGTAYGTMPIAAFLADYVQVTDAFDSSYLAFLGNPLYMYALDTYTWYDADGNRVAIDASTGNILVLKDKTAANPTFNKVTGDNFDDTLAADGTNRDDSFADQYDIAWYYNEQLDRYYQYAYDTAQDLILVNWMSDAEFEAWYKEAITYIKGTEYQYKNVTGIKGNDPYAKLDVFNIDADALAEIAQYKKYSIGVFSNTTEKCYDNFNSVNHNNSGNGIDMPTYTITGLDAGAAGSVKTFEVFVEAGHEAHETPDDQFAWINMAADVIGFKNEDGSYNNGVVLYDYNTTTGELEIVKYIPKTNDGTDKDSYWVTGILQGYSTKNASITVDGKKYYYGYDNLNGVPATMKLDNNGDGAALGIVDRRLSAEELDALLMQYVEVLVVDGKVVDIDALTAGSAVSQFLVVLGYAGMTSDGYIAVYAYDAATAELGVYKVNSFNGWKKGDYRYYPENAVIDAAFVPGTVYTAVSYDKATNSYGVETYELADMAASATAGTLAIEAGYRVLTLDNTTSVVAAAASHSYIIIDEFGVPYVVTGALADRSTLVGDFKDISGNGTKYIVFVDSYDEDLEEPIEYATGTFATAPYAVGFVMYTGGRVLEAAYDDAQDIVDYYLLGSTVSEVSVYNLMSGAEKYENVTFNSTNIDLVEGAIYMTIGNTIIRMLPAGYEDFIAYVTAHNAYTVIRNGYLRDTDDDSDYALAQALETLGLDVLPNNTSNEEILKAYADAKIGTVMIRDAADGDKIALTAGYYHDVDIIINGTTVLIYVKGLNGTYAAE